MKKTIIFVIIILATVFGYSLYLKNRKVNNSCEKRYEDWPKDKDIPFDECHPLYDPA